MCKKKLTERLFDELSELHKSIWKGGDIDSQAVRELGNELYKYSEQGYDVQDFYDRLNNYVRDE